MIIIIVEKGRKNTKRSEMDKFIYVENISFNSEPLLASSATNKCSVLMIEPEQMFVNCEV